MKKGENEKSRELKSQNSSENLKKNRLATTLKKSIDNKSENIVSSTKKFKNKKSKINNSSDKLI